MAVEIAVPWDSQGRPLRRRQVCQDMDSMNNTALKGLGRVVQAMGMNMWVYKSCQVLKTKEAWKAELEWQWKDGEQIGFIRSEET